MANDNNGANFLVGFFVGAAMGVMGALLLAPKSGRELRDEGRKLRDRAVDEGRRAHDRSGEVAGDLRERGEAAYEKGREGLSDTTEAARKTVQGVKEVLTRS